MLQTMQLIFADDNLQFLQKLEQLFRRSRMNATEVVPMVVNKPANYVYSALPPWTRACVVDTHEVHGEGRGELRINTTRTLVPTRFRERTVTRARISPPSAWMQSSSSLSSLSPAANTSSNYTSCDSPDGGDGGGSSVEKSNAYYATRAALIAAARIAKDHGLDVVVLPCMDSNRSYLTAHNMYAATRDFFKFQ